MRKPKTFNLFFGDSQLPIDIHSLAIDDVGTVVGASKHSFAFKFTYHRIPFTAQYRKEQDRAQIELVGDVGPMPFTAESAAARHSLQAIVAAGNQHLGETFRLNKGRIELVGSVPLPLPVTAIALIEAVIRFLAPRKGYLICADAFLPRSRTDRPTARARNQELGRNAAAL
jgi:hypothetical protein